MRYPHTASFDDVVGPRMTDRELMGLPPHFVACRGALSSRSLLRFAEAGPDAWLSTLQTAGSPFQDRLACGFLLGLSGDPRVHPSSPPMCDVDGGEVEVGLSPSDLDKTFGDLAGMGLAKDWIEKEIPRHAVTLTAFRIGAYPVTNSEFRTYLEETGADEIPTGWIFGRYPDQAANHPVHTVSADAADNYCAWLSRRTGRLFRLPTEAEWEHAAAGPRGSDYPWGDRWQPDRANTAEEGIFASTPIGCFPAGRSWCGAFDLAGNVEEYVADDYRAYPGGTPVHDDLALRSGSYRVARGGSYTRFRDLARTRRRHGRYASDIYVMGFRLAESLPDLGRREGTGADH